MPTLSIPAVRLAPIWAPSSHVWHVLFPRGMLMCEPDDDLTRLVTFLVAHQRLALGGERASSQVFLLAPL